MRASDELEAVDVVELACYFVSEKPARTARTHSPGSDVLWVAPDEVAKGPFVGDLLGTGDNADLVEGADFRAQAAMHAEDFAVDNGAENEEVEDLAAGFPDGGVPVLGHAFFIEAVDLCDLARFMVATDEGNAFRPALNALD